MPKYRVKSVVVLGRSNATDRPDYLKVDYVVTSERRKAIVEDSHTQNFRKEGYLDTLWWDTVSGKYNELLSIEIEAYLRAKGLRTLKGE